MRGVFVTGTDTGIGKTLVAAGLVRALKMRGLRVAALKPVVAGGAHQINGAVRWEDLDVLQAAEGIPQPLEIQAPYRLRTPSSPNIAARREGVQIQISRILEAAAKAAKSADCLVVEGAGGVLVPLNETEDIADLGAALALPMLLVVGIRLGCINHARLSMEVLRYRTAPVLGWVASAVDQTFPFEEETVQTLSAHLGPPLARIPHIIAPDAKQRAKACAPYLSELAASL